MSAHTIQSVPQSSHQSGGKTLHRKLALRDTFAALPTAAAVLEIANQLATPTNPNAPRPKIRVGSDHFLYAVLVTNGMDHHAACEQLELKPRTVEGWRSDLLKTARAYYGRDVEYGYVAEAIIQETLRRLQNLPHPN